MHKRQAGVGGCEGAAVPVSNQVTSSIRCPERKC